MKSRAPQQQDGEQALASLLSGNIFPGRSWLYLHEVANALSITPQHVVSLVLDGILQGTETKTKSKPTSRAHWKISVQHYDDFLRQRHSVAKLKEKKRRSPATASKRSARGVDTPRGERRKCKGTPSECKGIAAAVQTKR